MHIFSEVGTTKCNSLEYHSWVRGALGFGREVCSRDIRKGICGMGLCEITKGVTASTRGGGGSPRTEPQNLTTLEVGERETEMLKEYEKKPGAREAGQKETHQQPPDNETKGLWS